MRIKEIVFSIIFFCITNFLASETVEIGFIEKARGVVAKFYEEQGDLLKRGDIIYQNDKIITEGKGFAKIKFIDTDGFLLIGAESDITVSLFKTDEGYEKAFSLQHGVIFTSSKNLTRISTKNAVIFFRSAEVYIENRCDTLRVFCNKGNVRIESAWGEANLYETEEAIVLEEMTPYKEKRPERKKEISEIESLNEIIEIEMENGKMQKKKIILEIE